MTDKSSTSSQITFWTLARFLICAPVVIVVLALYAFGFTVYHKRKSAAFKKAWTVLYGIPFLCINSIFNIVCMTFILLELPREFKTTSRCKRHKISDDANRREICDFIGGQLDRYDEGHY